MQYRIVFSTVLSAALVAGYAIASYYTATHAHQTPWAPLLAVAPLILVGFVIVRQVFGKAAMLVAGLLLAWLLHRSLDQLQAHTHLLYYLQHLGFMFCGALCFGLSLLPGREPLCTRFARYAHPDLTPDIQRYSHGATVAWTAFFLLMALVSTLLFISPLPFSVWAAFDTLLTLPLVGLMFVLEYAARCHLLPNIDKTGVSGAFRAYQAYRADQTAGVKK